MSTDMNDELVDRIARRTLRLLGDAIRPELQVGRLAHEVVRSIADRLRVMEPLEDETKDEAESPGDFRWLGEMLLMKDDGQRAISVYECSRCGSMVAIPSRHLC